MPIHRSMEWSRCTSESIDRLIYWEKIKILPTSTLWGTRLCSSERQSWWSLRIWVRPSTTKFKVSTFISRLKESQSRDSSSEICFITTTLALSSRVKKMFLRLKEVLQPALKPLAHSSIALATKLTHRDSTSKAPWTMKLLRREALGPPRAACSQLASHTISLHWRILISISQWIRGCMPTPNSSLISSAYHQMLRVYKYISRKRQLQVRRANHQSPGTVI